MQIEVWISCLYCSCYKSPLPQTFCRAKECTQQQRKTFSLPLRPFTDKPRIHKTHNPVRTSDSNEHNLNSRCGCSCKSWHWKTDLQIYLKNGGSGLKS